MTKVFVKTGQSVITLIVVVLLLPVYGLLFSLDIAEKTKYRFSSKQKWIKQLEQERKAIYQTAHNTAA